MPAREEGLDRPVFVVGPPRSGTTLVRVMLDRHPDLHVLNETHLLDLWPERHPVLRTGHRSGFAAFWADFTASPDFAYLELDADAVYREIEARQDRDAPGVLRALLSVAARTHGVARVGEKTPDHARCLPALLGSFPDARVVYVLRDPRAVVASELRLERDWASDDPEEAAARWVRGAAPWLRHGDDERITTVRYEQLVAAPRETLRSVCDHLALDYDDRLLDDEGGHPVYRHGAHDPWGPLDQDGLDAWRDELTPEALAWVHATCGGLARRLGYALDDAAVPWPDRATVRARQLVRRLRRSLPTTVAVA